MLWLISVCKAVISRLTVRIPQTAHLCPSQSSPVSGHLRPPWQTLTLSTESHIPGAGWVRWWIFLGKKGGVILEVTLMWATFIKPRSIESGKWKKVVSLFFAATCRQAGHKMGEWGAKQRVLTQSHTIANGLKIRQLGSVCLHDVNNSQPIHHSCLFPSSSHSF